MMWRTTTFLKAYEKQGYALLFGKLGYFPVSTRSSFIIKTDEDLMIAESILKATRGDQEYSILYDELVATGD